MALDNRDVASLRAYPGAAFEADHEDGHRWVPERIDLAPAPAQRAAPARFDVVTASFEFPCALIDARARMLVESARRDGERHNISLWRAALRAALEQLSREAAHTPGLATCGALFWDRVGEVYRVAVTFELARRH
jgi:hypothetical protein